jgi:hypothetical protein
MGVDADVEVLGRDRDRLCGSCWRIVEGWLEPPGVAAGEDVVVAWLVETVLTSGSAMIEDVPGGRVRAIRQRLRREVKAAIGGTVTTALVSLTTIWVYSPLVIDAKSEEQQHRELSDAMVRLHAAQDGGQVAPPEWRQGWWQVIASRT